VIDTDRLPMPSNETSPLHPQPSSATGDAPMSHAREHALYYAARAAEYDLSVGYGTPRVEACLAPLKARFQTALKGHDALEVACGTGYWTQNAAATARSILAIDLDPASIALGQARVASLPGVRCQLADAYSLEGISGPFTAAFSLFWWSHMPKSKIHGFLRTLHARLLPGALVMFVDQLPYSHGERRRYDEEGNLLEARRLLSGGTFEIVKNFPTQAELAGVLAGFAEQLVYSTCPEKRWWMVSYRTAA
jgi:SAM-dependent methyltransferase